MDIEIRTIPPTESPLQSASATQAGPVVEQRLATAAPSTQSVIETVLEEVDKEGATDLLRPPVASEKRKEAAQQSPPVSPASTPPPPSEVRSRKRKLGASMASSPQQEPTPAKKAQRGRPRKMAPTVQKKEAEEAEADVDDPDWEADPEDLTELIVPDSSEVSLEHGRFL